jgi:hypothetical protein
MADPDFQSEFFEPIFLKLVVLNYKIKKGEQFSEKDKMLYDIVRYAFPIITRLMGDNKMTLTDAINITTEQRSNGTTTATTTESKSNSASGTTTTYHNGQYNPKGYAFTNASSEDCDSNEIEADDETKNVLSKLDVETARIIESTRNREWISISARDMIDDDEDEYEDSDSATEDNGSDGDNKDSSTIVTPVGTLHTKLTSVGCRGEYDDDYDDRDDNEHIPDMNDYTEGNYDNVVSDENFENVPLLTESVVVSNI